MNQECKNYDPVKLKKLAEDLSAPDAIADISRGLLDDQKCVRIELHHGNESILIDCLYEASDSVDFYLDPYLNSNSRLRLEEQGALPPVQDDYGEGSAFALEIVMAHLDRIKDTVKGGSCV